MADKHPPASPHGPVTQALPNMWFVQGGIKMPMLMPMHISRTMTVLRRADGELVVVNTMRLSEAGFAELDALGPVKHVVRIGGFHGRDDAFFKERYGAKVYALKGMEYRRGIGKKLGPIYLEPDVWLSEGDTLPIDDAHLFVIASSSPPEGIIVGTEHGGVAITGDALQNTPAPDRFHSFLAKVMLKRMGFFKPHAVGAGWIQFAKPSASDVRALGEHKYDNLFPGHGAPVIGSASEKFKPALNGELKGCH